MRLRNVCLGVVLQLLPNCLPGVSAFSTNVSLTSNSNSGTVVRSNFMGISIELSVINTLVGEDTSSIPSQMTSYLSLVHEKSLAAPRIRIGGNSMDDSIYNASQSQMIVNLTTSANSNDIPVSYGPVLYDVLASIASTVGGAEYLIGLSLILNDGNNQTLIAHTAEEKLGSHLDAFLVGNEPDLYGAHQKRPSNYSEGDYISEFANVTSQLNSSAYGDLILNPLLGGPTICCNWNLMDVLNEGYLAAIGQGLKYLNLQHYPQNNCNNVHNLFIDYYVNHTNAQLLAQWQIDGVTAAKGASKPILLGEFNSASCGGVPGISDTFAATLWAMDYALQLASVGYSGAYIHTRERGVTYNLFDPPPSGDSSTGWTTMPTFYSLLPVAESLSASVDNGSYVRDLNVQDDSGKNYSAAYGIYDANTDLPTSLVVFNYADAGNSSASFAVPIEGGQQTILLRTLTASSLTETSNISWGGETFHNVKDAQMVASGFAFDQQISCDSQCQFEVPSPGAAVLFIQRTKASNNASTSFAIPKLSVFFHCILGAIVIHFSYSLLS